MIFCDSAATVVQQLLGVPDSHAVLLEAGSLQGLDSRSRLQVILNKAGAKVEHHIWVAEGFFYMTKNERIDKGVSKGDRNTGLREEVPARPAGPPSVPTTS